MVPTGSVPPQPSLSTDGVTQAQVDNLTAHIRRLQDAIKEQQKQRRQGYVRRILVLFWLVYVTVAGVLRRVAIPVFGWRFAVAIIGAATIGGVFVVVTLSWKAGFVGTIVGAIACACLLYCPADSELAATLEQARAHRAVLRSEATTGGQHLLALQTNLAATSEQHNKCTELLRLKQYRESQYYRRQQLLKRDWKSLRSVPFENFLEEVCVELGYTVETTSVTGDQGADLIVSRDGHRVAIQVKGYLNSVSNSAVQEAYTSMAYYKCERCAVITNSRFTSSARDVAAQVGCVLIDEDNLPAFITGEYSLLPTRESQPGRS